MPQTAPNLSMARLRQHQRALEEFRGPYRAYLEAMFTPGRPQESELRARANALIPQAQMALEDTGLEVTMVPPPMFGHSVLKFW